MVGSVGILFASFRPRWTTAQDLGLLSTMWTFANFGNFSEIGFHSALVIFLLAHIRPVHGTVKPHLTLPLTLLEARQFKV